MAAGRKLDGTKGWLAMGDRPGLYIIKVQSLLVSLAWQDEGSVLDPISKHTPAFKPAGGRVDY